MRLVDNWRAVLRRAWSVRLMLLAGLLSGVEAALPFISEVIPMNPRALGVLTAGVVMLAVVARLVAQPTIGDKP